MKTLKISKLNLFVSTAFIQTMPYGKLLLIIIKKENEDNNFLKFFKLKPEAKPKNSMKT